MIKIRVCYLFPERSDVFTVSRVPCIGEILTSKNNGQDVEVNSVIHRLDADPETEVVAFVYVR